MNSDKNKKIILLLVILTAIFTILGGTFAYWSWISSEAQKTNIVFTVERTFSCAADGGGSITNNSAIVVPTLVNSNTSANYIKREVKVTPTINESGKTIYMDLWLDINKLDSGLSNSTHFNYAFTTDDSYPTEATRSGNFNGKKVGDKVILLDSETFSASTTDTYYLWIWLDAEETSSDTMDQSFSLSLNGSCTDAIPVEPNAPDLDDGMIPVVISDTGIVKTISKDDTNWYNYKKKQWANIVLVNDDSRSNYLNTNGVTVNEDDILAYYVWIPRYKYKIWSVDNESKTGQEQEIQIVFEKKSDSKTLGTQVGEYRTHPAFTFGDTELNGIWVGKFRTGRSSTNVTIVKPDVATLVGGGASTQFTISQQFGTSTYGSTSKVDAHMMKNSEWGAVAYLSHSKYGANREIYHNNSERYSWYTGRSGGNVAGNTAANTVYADQTSTFQSNSFGYYTWNGYLLEYNTNNKTTTHDISKVASTTGNITGVYDMSGGVFECVMGVFANSSGQLWSGSDNNYKSGFTGLLGDNGNLYTGVDFPDSKYYDVYKAENGITINPLTACDGGICYGHGLSEINGWYGDFASFISASYPWLRRSGSVGDPLTGLFGFSNSGGGNYAEYGLTGFHSVISYVG